eukprot:TRINITY_DN20988_c0_g1_i1.p1 TRINITY_DN20988_c0_g1~~TRINITY_DN20988_c0_g1_i1.p1  ORF type:complete len:196 (+),score=26.96 TRINITY_DN20988_c0_g1_i1:58-645(+)
MQLYENFELKLIRTFFFFSTGVHGLCGVILILTGAWHTNNENENLTVDKIHKSANPFFGWIVIITGWLLVLWTLVGWYALVKKSRELDIICVFLNVAMMILQVILYFILCSSTEFHEKKNIILVAVFAVSIISSAIHLFIFIIKCRTKFSHKENLGKEILESQILKPPSVVHKLSFNPDVYNHSHLIDLDYNNGS